MQIVKFGTTSDGRNVEAVEITGGGMRAHILTYSAVLQDLRLEKHESPLVLGFDTFPLYENHSPNFGSIVGRCANRISHGQFSIDGKTYQADINFLEKHCLHGGTAGFSKRLWSIDHISQNSVCLSYFSKTMEMGFPGNLTVTCTYSLLENGCLRIEMTGQTDATTICNLAHHSYFNLEDGGKSSALTHQLQIFADQYLDIDQEGIPNGKLMNVDHGLFNFKQRKLIQNGDVHQSYDHNYCLHEQRRSLTLAAKLQAPTSGVTMELHTTESGLQFYDGARAGRDFAGLDGILYHNYAGICLEPQTWTDAINHPHFPQSLIHPEKPYHQLTEYRFSKKS